MTPYTVVWHNDAQDELTNLWIASNDRATLSAAANAIDTELSADADAKGIEVAEGLRQLTISPLRVLFAVSEPDRMVWVASVYIA